MARKFLILAGSNFVGTPIELHGCLNDLTNIRAAAEAAGFVVLVDLRGAAMTAAAWRGALTWAVDSVAQPDDLIAHAHSHHGAQVPDPSEPDGLAECWCPDDFDWSAPRMITGAWMGTLLARLPHGAIWVDWADCCHAADSLRDLDPACRRPRCLVHPGAATSRRRAVARMGLQVQRRGPAAGGTIIQLAACGQAETAADTEADGQPCGAFTHALLQTWRHAAAPDTYAAHVAAAAASLARDGYDQHPELDATPGAATLPFLAYPTGMP
jgi:hypothetical protein